MSISTVKITGFAELSRNYHNRFPQTMREHELFGHAAMWRKSDGTVFFAWR
jgi:hypothetical protein